MDKKERQRRDRLAPKCWCGNVAGLGQTHCGRHRDDRQTERAEDAEFIRDVARRIFENCTPAMGFDQGDSDRLIEIAGRLA